MTFSVVVTLVVCLLVRRRPLIASALFVCALAAALALSPRIAAQTVADRPHPKPLTQYRHDAWQTQQGLPQNSVHALVLRRDGYLWIGTEAGLVRFDGVTPTTFDRQSLPALKDPKVKALYEDADKVLWVGTDEGMVLKYTGEDFVPVPMHEPLHPPIRAFYQDKSGVMWVAAGEQVARLVKGDGKQPAELVALKGSRGLVYGFEQDGQGGVWVATGGGLARVAGDHLVAADFVPNTGVRVVHQDKQGTLWLGTVDGLWRVNGRDRRHYTVANGLPANDIRALLEDHNGALWIGTAGGGVARLTQQDGPDAIQAYTQRDGLTDSAVTVLAEDHEDSIWIGTQSGGLNRLRAVPFGAITHAEGLPPFDVLSVYEDSSQRLWVGTDGGGLTCFTPTGVITYTTSEGLPSNTIWTTWQADDGSLWAGTGDRGLARFANGVWTSFASHPEMPQGGIRAIFQDRSGALWIGNREGLHRIRNGAITTFTRAQGLSSNNVSAIQEDREGTLWIGTLDGGLIRMKDDKFTAYTTTQGLSTNDVSAIAVQGPNVFVGTFDGRLHLVRNDRVLALPTRDRLTTGRVLQILPDERNQLWVSGQRGVMRYEVADLMQVANGMAAFASPRVFDRLEGFGRWEFNGMSQTSGWRRASGQLAFAGAAGVVTLDPTELTKSSFTPPVQIERVLSNDKEVPARGPIELPPGQNQLEFHYTALSLAVPTRVAFRYRLEGIDSDWIDAGTRRVAYYANVPGGSYKFHVIAANHDGVWGQSGAVLTVSVAKHFYETVWFYAFCGVIALAGLAGLSRWRVRRLQARERMLARLVEERTSALAEEVGERRRIERSLRQAKDVLEDRVRERTNELAVAYAKLQHDVAERRRLEEQLSQVQKLESIGRLAGGVAHDLNNVLTVVLSYADLLDAGLGQKHPLQDQLRQIRRAAERASNLTHRLLAFARQQVVEPRVVNLSELTLSLDGMLRRLIGEDIELVTVTSSGLWSVKTDPHQIEQILVNLVVNARDAMPTGGKLTVATTNTVVDDEEIRRHPTLKLGEYVLLTVTDTGTGINAYVKQHLFEPFFTTKEQGKGTGLGLATCYGIVQQLTGHIVVDSEEGHGATFRVYLPKVDLPAQPVVRAEESPQVPRGSETVLLVEDEPLVRQIAENALTDQGYRVLEAENGEEALRVATNHNADDIALVLTDVVMPRMGGRELSEKLRIARPGIRVLYMSGYAASTIDEQDVVEPGTAFLRKPFTLADMLRKVRDVLDDQPAVRQ